MALERLPPFGGNRVPARGLAIDEFLFHRDVLRLLELAELSAQVAVGFVQQRLETAEGDGVGAAEQGQRPQPAAVLEHRIELIEGGGRLGLEVRLRTTQAAAPSDFRAGSSVGTTKPRKITTPSAGHPYCCGTCPTATPPAINTGPSHSRLRSQCAPAK